MEVIHERVEIELEKMAFLVITTEFANPEKAATA